MLCSLTWLASPPLARWVIGDALAEMNLTLNSNSSVRVNLFISKITITNFSIQSASKQTTHSVNKLQIDYSLRRLLAKEVRIDQILLDGMTLSLKKTGQQITVAGVALNNAEASADQTAESDNKHQDAPSN